MNRSDFQTLTEVRIRETLVLLENQCYEGAYYLAGYAVECALKACIARNTNQYDFPPDRNTINRIYSHNLEGLLKEAGLERDRRAQAGNRPAFSVYWKCVTDWSEEARYEQSITRQDAENLYLAIMDEDDGVLLWLSNYW